jgi:hypothetical protein
MTDNYKTGGSAFPRSLYTQGGAFDSSSLSQGYGMTLRDYFAAKAMQAFLSRRDSITCPDEIIAQDAYNAADAMLEAREQ